MTSETLAAIGALLGALGALIPQISTWLRDRSQQGVERRQMDLVSREIDLISKWLEATAGFTSEQMQARKAQAEQRLIDLLEFDERPVAAAPGPEAEKPKPGLVQNVLFYAYAGFFLFMVFGASIDSKTNDVSLATLFTGENMSLLGFFAIPLVALYFIRARSRKVRD